jgi:hypothetical protein
LISAFDQAVPASTWTISLQKHIVITHPPCALGELLIQDSDESR